MLRADPIPPDVRLQPPANPQGVELYLRREDMLHPLVSGNKWRKLKYNLLAARSEGHHTLLTFGGAYSNHIHALAAAAREAGMQSIGVIRGEEHRPLNPTLTDAVDMGMRLHYLDRAAYRHKTAPEVVARLHESFGDFYLVPEGGTNLAALRGVAEIVRPDDKPYDYYCLACGTGGTAAGLVLGLQGRGRVLAFSVLKGHFHTHDIRGWLHRAGSPRLNNWEVNTAYHFGGYARYDQRLICFINSFRACTGIPLDPIYTGKMMYGVFDLVARGYFPAGSRVLTLHTGGLQGIRGFNQRFGGLIEI